MYPNPIPLPIPPYLSSALAASPLTKTTQTNKQANLTMEAAVCHGVTHYTHPFLQIASSADVHCSESSLQCEVSINTESSQALLSDVLLLPCHGEPASFVLQDWPLHTLQQFIDGVDVGWANSTSCIGAWLVAELLRPTAILHPGHHSQPSCFAQARGRASSPALFQ